MVGFVDARLLRAEVMGGAGGTIRRHSASVGVDVATARGAVLAVAERDGRRCRRSAPERADRAVRCRAAQRDGAWIDHPARRRRLRARDRRCAPTLGVPGHAARRDRRPSTSTVAALCAHARTRSGCSPEVERVVDDQPRTADLPHRLEHQRSRVVAARRARAHPAAPVAREKAPPRSSSRIEKSSGVESTHGQQSHATLPSGVDERGRPRVGEERVLADRMLHGAQPS